MNKYKVKQNAKALGGFVIILMVVVSLLYVVTNWWPLRGLYVGLFVMGIICYIADRLW